MWPRSLSQTRCLQSKLTDLSDRVHSYDAVAHAQPARKRYVLIVSPASSLQGGKMWRIYSPTKTRLPMPWMRDCHQCHRMLIKRHLSEALKCICGWIWS